MKIYNWDDKKNQKLKQERGISFEEVVFCIENRQLLDILEHPNSVKYKGQRLYVVGMEEYAYIVPFVVQDDEIFLKTIFPSRKFTKMYFNKG